MTELFAVQDQQSAHVLGLAASELASCGLYIVTYSECASVRIEAAGTGAQIASRLQLQPSVNNVGTARAAAL